MVREASDLMESCPLSVLTSMPYHRTQHTWSWTKVIVPGLKKLEPGKLVSLVVDSDKTSAERICSTMT